MSSLYYVVHNLMNMNVAYLILNLFTQPSLWSLRSENTIARLLNYKQKKKGRDGIIVYIMWCINEAHVPMFVSNNLPYSGNLSR